MRNKRNFKERKQVFLLFSLILGLAMMAGAYQFGRISVHEHSDTIAQNSNSEKWSRFSATDEHFHKFGKARSYLTSEIVSESKGPFSKGAEFRLRGIVKSKHPVSNVNVRWDIPDSLVIVSGRQDQTFNELAPENPIEVEIVVQSQSDQNRQVHLAITAEQGSTKMGHVSQFNTVFEDFLIQQKDAKIRALKTDREEGKDVPKIFQ